MQLQQKQAVVNELEYSTTEEVFRELARRFPALVVIYIDDKGQHATKHLLFAGSDVAAYGLCAYAQYFLTHSSQRIEHDDEPASV